ncbi:MULTISPECIES: LacI family DNA-binding transcriptional regulator [Aestuariimicrobium]|uniref:LacI family DNA-binding transcriptional regulator n=1 Tax=Aestuariimicrobium TaxID=396388 RepID=UPI0003B31C79|nr:MULTISPECIES: LacI family DNA-binding transcriptional regulator [Aestuariimicrobium]CAI9399908.1 Ribose operon repressor [Aestuariimicrobium sp. T2.26MG-19.2B]
MSTASETPRRGRASITDVARLAGVSAQTVSRVATGSSQVRESTKLRVRQAMDQLGYSPNRAARALRSGSFGAIGLLGHDFSRTGEVLTMRGVLDAAQERGYSVNVVNVATGTTDEWNSAVTRLPHLAMDALIVIRAELVQPELLSLPARMPVVVNGTWPGSPHSTVETDQVEGTRLAVEHLLGLGHATVHHVSGPEDSEVARIRSSAWRRTLLLHGITPPEVVPGDWTAASGIAACHRLVERDDMTAVFCANDETAIALIGALQRAGKSVPGDVSVVGFDDIDLAAYLNPPLTTVNQNFHAIGQHSVAMLLEQLEASTRGERPPLQRVVVPVELMVRGSTGPPPRVAPR